MKQLFFILITVLLTSHSDASNLRGSRESLKLAHKEAIKHDFTFLRSQKQLAKFISQGYLVKLESDRYLQVDAQTSRPYVRPEVRIFVQLNSEKMLNDCGERMVITSALRLTTEQPRNASDLSVHPTGMALDIRVPATKLCREWLENNFLFLEEKGLIDITKERWPAHYHVTIFPKQYATYVATEAKRDLATHTIIKGESLASIARRRGTTYKELAVINGINPPYIVHPGQIIRIR